MKRIRCKHLYSYLYRAFQLDLHIEILKDDKSDKDENSSVS
jgi:hypothetical protein